MFASTGAFKTKGSYCIYILKRSVYTQLKSYLRTNHKNTHLFYLIYFKYTTPVVLRIFDLRLQKNAAFSVCLYLQEAQQN